MNRPWQGQQEQESLDQRPQYDPECYLCPGNRRAGDHRNPQYDTTFVFTNDFSALLPDSPEICENDHDLFQMNSVRGTSRVLCFSPRHNLSLAEMSVADIQQVVELWISQTGELGAKYPWIQVFENKGAIMGCSNPHPHGQIWAGDRLPSEPAKEDQHQLKYFEKYKSVLLMDYIKKEQQIGERIILENDFWLVIVPYWAVWPFETLLLPKRAVQQLPGLNDSERQSLSIILKELLSKYDNIFNCSFPYSMGWHGAPFDKKNIEYWQLHAHFYPPLLRSATVKKFMVGYEMLSEAQRDITPEQAAEHLRNLPTIHYKAR